MFVKRDLISIYDLSINEVDMILNKAFEFKKNKKTVDILKGKTLGILLEKPSTRTVTSFSVGMAQLGGTPIFIDFSKSQIPRGESIHDTSMVFSCYLDIVMIRVFKHSDIEEFAMYSTIPIINGLTDYEHPCQTLSTIMTIMELYKINKLNFLKDIKITYIGDGNNNIANSLIAISAILGLCLTIISPNQYYPKKETLNKALKYVNSTNVKIKITNDINVIKNSDVIYTDVWTSMGFETELEHRKNVFSPYQVNEKLLKIVSKKCIVLHCLPAIKGEEITSDVFDKYEYCIFKEVENRLYIQKSVLLFLLNKI
ncbi:MAG: ornithine carbamoyltransferase [Endomicrobium sp.]|jgi:ornithine carbamoyltransferase|nr:ornithine carbamoyltransferase [Endomicrobium sp.]